MICTIFRHKRTKNGKVQISRLYRGRYRLDDDSKITEVALKTSDKRVARERLEQIVRDRQMEQSGMIPPEAIRTAALSPIEEHLKNFIADLQALNRDKVYVYNVNSQNRRLIRDCAWKALRDITADSFQSWRVKQNKAPKTLNEYLNSVSSFLSWMEKHGRIALNPLKHVQKVETNGKQVRPRRAFSSAEMERLLKVAGRRKVVYLTAVFTGLRRSELAALERRDVHLEKEKQFLNVRASTTKNRKQANLALHADVAKELDVLLNQLPPTQNRVFAGRIPKMKRFKADLVAAGIPFIDDNGHRADFHSLRHTLATNLARAGTAPRVAMEIMRHSDMRLTAKTYTDAGLLPIADAVLSLPSFLFTKKLEPKTDTQIDPQSLFRAGQNLSDPVTEKEESVDSYPAENQQVSCDSDGLVTTCQNDSKSGPYRIRTYGLLIRSQAL